MIRNLYKIKEFPEKLLDLVVELSKDRIIIVRIALAISISHILRSSPEAAGMFREAIANLKQDEEDVREYFE